MNDTQLDNRPLLPDFDADLRAQIPDFPWLNITGCEAAARVLERARDAKEAAR